MFEINILCLFSISFIVRYFFSTLETDYLLCNLQDDDEDEEEDDSAVEIISEDIKLPETSILIDENLRKQLV